MSSSDAVTETLDEGTNGLAGRLGSLAETVGPQLARHAESGNLAAASGVVSLVRAGQSFLKGDRKRGVLQALGGLFWVGVALAQRRSGGSGGPGASDERRESDLTEVADTSPDVEDAVEPGGRDADHATGESVVDTTDADIEESDTAPEVETDADDVDQRDVTGATDVEDAVEGETETETDRPATESEDATELDESAETDDSPETDEATATEGDD
ncbi:hypothetical protein M0R89_11940 [Halorussus limi]|uniref:Uncharacterized protein n=1 Tax=Halorussus limi TaxID=2938695 RepID=A0A8U0HRF8_9EURY|nr:hypothetical protein [Halorussus limi]UPV73254.1 hypothetical protein M0R89_11940 [Halorussus limi]